MTNSTEERLQALRTVLADDYPECTCPEDDKQPLCVHCLIIESINEVGAILDDIWRYLLGLPHTKAEQKERS